jgi:hypothetical protein
MFTGSFVIVGVSIPGPYDGTQRFRGDATFELRRGELEGTATAAAGSGDCDWVCLMLAKRRCDWDLCIDFSTRFGDVFFGREIL